MADQVEKTNQIMLLPNRKMEEKKFFVSGTGVDQNWNFVTRHISARRRETKKNKIMQRPAAAKSSEKIVARIRPCLTFINHPNG